MFFKKAREAGLLARLRHPNIVSLHKVIDTGKTVVLLLELITGGELFHWTPSNEVEAAHVVRSKSCSFFLISFGHRFSKFSFISINEIEQSLHQVFIENSAQESEYDVERAT